MGTITETDLRALVGEQQVLMCEHSGHRVEAGHADEPATHYVRARHKECGRISDIYASCPGFVALTRSNETTIRCGSCRESVPGPEIILILAPIGGS
jgi:hypothetical protein